MLVTIRTASYHVVFIFVYFCNSYLHVIRDADKTMSLLHAPEILVLHVKRFRRGYFWSHKVYNR